MERVLFTRKADIAKLSTKSILQVAIENFMNNEMKDTEIKLFNILKVGRIVEGQACFHETDSVYKEIGIEFEIEIQSKFLHEFNEYPEISKGFYAVWTASKKSCEPIDFEEGNGEMGKVLNYTNGFGDNITILKEIHSMEDTNKALKELISEGIVKLSKEELLGGN